MAEPDVAPASATEAAPAEHRSAGAGLSKKVGPFKVGQWLLILAAGVGLGLAGRKLTGGGSKAATAATIPSDAYTAPAGQQGTIDLQDRSATYSGGDTVAPSGPTDNGQWRRQALNTLVALNQGDPSTIDSALAKYLEGIALTAQERAIINLAITKIGAPPEYVPPITDVTVAPAPEPAPPGQIPQAPAPEAAPLGAGQSPAELAKLQEYFSASFYQIARWKQNNGDPNALAYLGVRTSDLQREGASPGQVKLYRVWLQQNGHSALADA